MMSVGPSQYNQKSKLQLLQADFQNKLMKEKEERLLRQLQNEQIKQQKTIGKYQTKTESRVDSFSAPGGVRHFFSERRTNPGYGGDKRTPKSGSASYAPTRKRAGYDKSNLLTPLNRTPQKTGPSRKSKITSENQPTEFQKWREEQDGLDRQRRERAQNKQTNGDLNERLAEYKSDVEELEMMKRQEAEMRKMMAIQKEEEEREKKQKILHKQEQKRKEQAEIGRRRKEEAEQRRKEAAERRRRQELQHERGQPAEPEEDQDAMIQRLEEELERKKNDLFKIQTRDYDHEPTPRENSYSLQTRSNRSPETAEEVFPTKPRKVNRGHSRNKMASDNLNVVQPSPVLSSPTKSHTSHSKTDLNSTYSVKKSKPKAPARDLPAMNRQEERPIPTVVHREHPNEVFDEDTGKMIKLASCSVCGRKFNEERLIKHQKACKSVSKPRKKFNVMAQRIAGSGAEEFIGKKPAAGFRRNANKPNKGKKDWRKQHEDFIAAIRYAKKAADIEKNGGDITTLAPPPKTDTSDYVQCPHCNRKFNENAGERHIAKCQEIRAKPTMLRKGAGTRR